MGSQLRPCAHELFERQAALSADAIAAVDSQTGDQITYGALNAAANRVAHFLRRRGVQPEELVGLCAGRSLPTLAAILGVLKAGAAYVPFDQSYPAERLRFMAGDARVRIFLTDRSCFEKVPSTGAEVLLLEELAALCASEGAENPAPVATPESLAYAMYTSGSTGTPKGVLVPHRAIARLVLGQSYATFGPEQVVLALAPLSFDASTFELWAALAHGGRLVLVPQAQPSLEEIGGAVRAQGVTTLWLTAGLFALMVEQRLADLRGLRQLLAGGDVLPLPAVRRVLDELPHVALINGYGPTECTTFACCHRVTRADLAGPIPIGRPIAETTAHVIDGELFLGGAGLAHGYLHRPELTADRFITLPSGERVYRTGDRVRARIDGVLEFLGRADGQVKIRGHRVEPGELEATLLQHPAIAQAAVAVRDGAAAGDKSITAYVVAREPLDAGALKGFLAERLPPPLVPAQIVFLPALPLGPTGKIDRAALPQPTGSAAPLPPRTELERIVARVFAQVLGRPGVGLHDGFFDLGGSSLTLLAAHGKLSGEHGLSLAVTDLFAHPTVAALAGLLAGESRKAAPGAARSHASAPIAIVGMAGRFPGARSVAELWKNVQAGVDSISRFSPAELEARDPAALAAGDSYVRARGLLEGVEQFDAAYFGIPPRDAAVTDPQQRVFLEICHQALEDAGIDPDRAGSGIGVWAGQSLPTYLLSNVLADRAAADRLAGEYQVGSYPEVIGNDKDYLATRVAHKLDLGGPAVNVQSACSTSLVAVCQAVWALQAGQCDAALAGGVSITFPQRRGYLYNEGGMVSPDGKCRPFDAAAGGTVFSSGAGVVVLKRLEDAERDGDRIYAVIKAAAANNDGARKVGFAAPSVERQAEVIARAHQLAGVSPDSIGYVETHGTGTPLGDPIEVAGLVKAFGPPAPGAKPHCALGALKANTGHMEVASGVAGLIRAALVVGEGLIPPVLHFEKPNPRAPLEGSRFYFSRHLTEWPASAGPRRAGVSSFGVGGTNAHLIIEEPPSPVARPVDAQRPQLLVVSAKSDAAASAACANLARHVGGEANLADVAHTLWVGRRQHAHRRAAVVASGAELASATWTSGVAAEAGLPVAFLFPGQGAQHPGMARRLYQRDAAFRASIDEPCESLRAAPGLDLREAIFTGPPELLAQTRVTQPALFVVEHALAQAWLRLGVVPQALAGHSVGEYVAAALAGVMSPSDALQLVAARGQLIQELPAGAMLSVRLSEAALLPHLPEGATIAAVNAPGLCVAAGSFAAIEALEARLTAVGAAFRRLRTSHAFHSPMMDAALPAFAERVARVELHPPKLPIASSCTGRWLTAEEATSPDYWVRHVRQPVRFADALALLRAEPRALVEVGPGRTLTQLALQSRKPGAAPAIATLGDATEPDADDEAAFLSAAGRLWTAGARIDLGALHQGARRRVSLPTYPFERKRHFIDPPAAAAVMPAAAPQTSSSSGESNMSARKDRLIAELRSLIEDGSGLELAGAPADASFLELGLDSLFLTQFALTVQQTWPVKVSFRQLLEGLSSMQALAEHLDAALPAEAAPAPQAAPARPAEPIAMTQTNSASSRAVQAIVEQQLRLMAEQLALLRGGGVAPASEPVHAAAVPAQLPPAAELRIEAASPVIAAQPPPQNGDDSGLQKYDAKKAFGAIARIHKDRDELTPKQKARLEALVRRYTARTKASKAFTQASRTRLADPRAVSGFRPVLKELVYPVVVERSKGCRFWDLDGNEYIDALNGFGSNFFGYQPDFVAQALKDQIDRGYEVGPQHPLAAECADLVCELTGLQRAAFCNTGSEAVMGAVRVARTVTGRKTIAFFTGSYHGIFDEVIARPGKKRSVPGAPGILPEAMQNSLILEYGTPESLEILRARAGELAAVLVEPIQSRRPDFQPREFLHELRKITAASGTALIFDEVITGFRLAQGGAQAFFDVKADLASYGKVVSAGLPIGVIAGKREWMDALDGGHWQFGDASTPTVGVTYFAGTFVRHPLALAACKAALQHLKDRGPKLQEELNARTTALAAELNAHCQETNAPIAVKHMGSLWKTFFTEDVPFSELLFCMMRDRGIHILDGFPCFLTLAHAEADVKKIATAFAESVAEMQEAGFLPGGKKEKPALDPNSPPVPGARLGRDQSGQPAWFVPHPSEAGKFVQVEVQ